MWIYIINRLWAQKNTTLLNITQPNPDVHNCWWQWVTLSDPSFFTKVDPIVPPWLCRQPMTIPILPHKIYNPIPQPVTLHVTEGPLPVHCVCLCYRPLVYRVCPNYELVEFQPQTMIPPKPRLCHLLLHSYSWLAPPSPPSFWCPYLGGQPHPTPTPPPPTSVFISAQDHMPTRGVTCIYPRILKLPRLPLPCCCLYPHFPTFPHPLQNCRIPIATGPLPLTKSIITWTSTASLLPLVSTTAPRASPLPCSPSPLGIPLR